MKTKFILCLALGLFLAGCTSSHPTSNAARSSIDSPLLAGPWGELDTGAAFTFAADGSFQMSHDGRTLGTGRYTVISPDAIILTFLPTAPHSSPHEVKYYYFMLKNGTRLLTTESFGLDSIRKRQ
jgi:hypothetical protein